MKLSRADLAKKIFSISHLTGQFKLRSGKTSTEYFDKYRFESQPEILEAIGAQMAELVPEGIDALAGLEMGGIPVATAISLMTGRPTIFVRKEAKDYGTCRIAEGLESLDSKKLCIVEDVVTTGGQILLSVEDLRKEGAKVEHVLCVICREPSAFDKLQEHGLKLHALFTMEELKSHGQKHK
jgi:orotate phosphoribosyltransferase